MRLVEAKLVRKPANDGCSLGFPVEWIEKASLRALMHAIDLLESSARSVNPGLDVDQRLSAATALANWPHGYHRLLRAVGNQALKLNPDASGLCKQFEHFYGPFFRNSTLGREFSFLREEFIRFGQDEWGRAAILPKLNGEARASARFTSKTDFAREHGLNNTTLNRMIRDGDVVAVTTKEGRGGRTIIDVEGSKVPKHVHPDEATIFVRDAARLIGLPVAVIRALRRSGTLKAPLRTGRGGTWYRSDVDAFLETVKVLSAGLTNNADGLCLADVMRLKFRSADAKAKVVAAVIDGRVPLVGATGGKVGNLQVDRASIDAVVLETRIASLGGTQSLPQAADTCGISLDVVADAIAKGLLSVTVVDGYERVTEESIADFRQKFVPLVRLADDLKTSTRPLVRVCDELGIPVQRLDRSSGTAAQPLIRAEDAAKVTFEFQNRARAIELRTFDGRSGEQVRRLEAYLAELQATGTPLPRRGGAPNRSTIARACGFDRSVLDKNPKCAESLRIHDEAEQANGTVANRSPEVLLRGYLDALRCAGEELPIWNGKPNRLQISKACGFDRSALDGNATMSQLIEDFMAHPSPQTTAQIARQPS